MRALSVALPLLFTLVGCATHANYPVVGVFEQYKEVLIGQVDADLSTGVAQINVDSQVSNLRCWGSSRYTGSPWRSCAGQGGVCSLQCNDGRVVSQCKYVLSGCTSGSGRGEDANG